MNIYRKLIASFVLMTGLFAQSIVVDVKDVEYNPLVGANVVVEGTELGGVTNETGLTTISVEAGTYTITASFIGYSSQSKEVVVGDSEVKVNIALAIDALTLTDVEVLASRAVATTPVAYSMVSKEEMELRLGSQDVPMALNTTPIVYATLKGCGAVFASINV